MSRRSKEDDDVRKADNSLPEKRRLATVYDAVAGRIVANGFLTREEQINGSIKPLRTDEVLSRRLDAPQASRTDYHIANKVSGTQQNLLPDSELLKDVHEYVADFYEAISKSGFDFHSLDESALLAMGILLEEATKEAIGESGDMVFAEPQSIDRGLPESKLTRYQVVGKVVPRAVQEYHSASDEEDVPVEAVVRSRKRRRYRREDE